MKIFLVMRTSPLDASSNFASLKNRSGPLFANHTPQLNAQKLKSLNRAGAAPEQDRNIF